MDSKKYDLTNGSILNKLLLISLPIMGTNVMQMSYNLTDLFWLGRLGNEASGAVAAAAVAGVFVWISAAFLVMGRTGAQIGVSQGAGRSDTEWTKSFAASAFQFAAVMGTAVAFIFILNNQYLIGFFNLEDVHVVSNARVYLVITSIGLPLMFVSAVATGVFNGSGNSRIPFIINGIGFLINMILDPLLIFRMQMGVTGAAIATVIANSIVCIISLLAIKRSRQRPFEDFRFFIKPDPEKLKQILKWGTPTMLENLFFGLLIMINSRIVAQWGPSAVAASRIGSQIDSLTWLVAGGYSVALTSFVGQNFGANKPERIESGYKISTAAMFIWGAFVSCVLYFLGGTIGRMLVPDEETVVRVISYARCYAIIQIPVCLEYVAAGCFRGKGRTGPPSVCSIIGNTLRIPLALILSRTSLGLTGAFLGLSVGVLFRSLPLCIWYFKSRRRA